MKVMDIGYGVINVRHVKANATKVENCEGYHSPSLYSDIGVG